ncbi:unnamed protein product [Schistosoma intercalatum]|nr:unnamed protein product [Schistosoma intercalatum]
MELSFLRFSTQLLNMTLHLNLGFQYCFIHTFSHFLPNYIPNVQTFALLLPLHYLNLLCYSLRLANLA